MAVIGAGNLGQALADYPGFPSDGFVPVALFDRAASKIGTQSKGGVPIFHMRRLPAIVRKEGIRIAMHRRAGRGRAAGGERGGRRRPARRSSTSRPGSVTVPPGVKVKNVDLTVSLEGLAYHLANTVHAKTKLRSRRPACPTWTRAGRVRMVDVSAKARHRARGRRARPHLHVGPPRSRRSAPGAIAKGDPLQAARIAGIMGAKRTSDLVPLCHPLPLTHVDVELTATPDGYDIEARARTTAPTGVEMEALTAVSVAALTVYDMVKAVDKTDGHRRDPADGEAGRPLGRMAAGNESRHVGLLGSHLDAPARPRSSGFGATFPHIHVVDAPTREARLRELPDADVAFLSQLRPDEFAVAAPAAAGSRARRPASPACCSRPSARAA